MHACLNFSLLLCHCFGKSKSRLQKLNVCIHMYESVHLGRDEQASTTVGFASNKRQKQVVKVISLHKLSGGSLQQTLFRAVSMDLFSFLHAYSPSLSLPRSGLPSLVFFPPVVFSQGDFTPQGMSVCCNLRDATKI